MIGTTTRDALAALDKDERTDAIVLVGEIGGAMEESAAEYAAGMKKPVVAFIAGRASPPGKKMGHAGAIVTGNCRQLRVEAQRAGKGRRRRGRYATRASGGAAAAPAPAGAAE